ncbi:hypothetical protein BH10CHL1_BH10CHL1_22510 [soil metagenome]
MILQARLLHEHPTQHLLGIQITTVCLFLVEMINLPVGILMICGNTQNQMAGSS